MVAFMPTIIIAYYIVVSRVGVARFEHFLRVSACELLIVLLLSRFNTIGVLGQVGYCNNTIVIMGNG